MRKASRCFAIFVMLLSALPVYSQKSDKLLLPGEESPASFYSLSLDSDDVILFLAGSWKIDLSAATGFSYSPVTGLNNSIIYPGFADGFSFNQVPDITVSLLLLEKILFETAFMDDFDDSTFRLAYLGDEDEFVRLVSAGNMGINLSDDTRMSDFFYVPGGDASSFGVHSILAGPFSEHELLFRFDPQDELKKLYIGSDLLVEIERQPSEYLRGKMFYIPGYPADAVFYAESAEEDSTVVLGGRYFRRLAAGEYSYSASSGRLLLEEPAVGAVLVYSDSADWTAEGAAASTVSTGIGTMLMIFDPGFYSEFESASVYSLNSVLPADEWKTRAFLASDADTAASGIELDIEILSEEGLVILAPSAGGTPQFPLYGLLSAPETIYGPQSVQSSSGSSKKIFFRARETASSYSADDPVPGTIRIFINGNETHAWSESNGVITFDVPPADNDRIEITYRKNTGSTGGDILFATANRFFLSDEWTADLNAGLRLNISEGYALPGEETSAFGGISAGIEWDNTEKESPLSLKTRLTAGIKLIIENSTGNLLLKSMSGDSLEVAITRNTIFPASTSASPLLNLDPADRGLLLYRDYRIEAGISGYYLQDYTESIPDGMVFSPVESTTEAPFKAGPYTASAQSDDRNGEILIMDYVLDGTDSWTGVQIPLNTAAENIDLSGSKAVSIDFKSDSNLTGIELNLEIGSLSEDLDGDGNLDMETTEYGSGYIFDDPNSEGGTLIGGDNLTGSNGILDTEDINGNGFIDIEKTDGTVLFQDISKPGSDWSRLRLYFSDAAGSQARNRLKNAEFIRITAVNRAVGEKTGRILFDDIRIEGASFTAEVETGFSEPEYSELRETLIPAAEKPESALESPTVIHSTSNDIMRLSWSDDWKIQSYITPVAPEDYAGLTFFYHCPAATETANEDALIHIHLTDRAGLGYKASIPLAAGSDWHKVQLKLPGSGRSGGVTIDGVQSAGAGITCDAGSSDLSLLTIYTEGTDSGIIYIDEIYLNSPVLKTLAGVNEYLELGYSESILKFGDFEVIGPLSFSQNASVLVDSEADQIMADNADYSLATELSSAIAGAPVSANFSASGPDAILLSGGHRIAIPLDIIGLKLTDIYQVSNNGENLFSKSDLLDFSIGILSADAGFKAGINSNQLLRNWFGNIETANDIFNLGIKADFLLSDLNHSVNTPDYFTGWYSGTLLVADFSYTDLQQRKTTLGLSAGLPLEPVGFGTDLTFISDINDENIVSNSAEINLELPFSFYIGKESIKLTLAYSRLADFNDAGVPDNFASDIPILFSSVSTGGHLYTSVPYYEIFDSALPRAFYNSADAADIDSADFTNEAGIILQRNYSSRLIDLILPYSLESSLSREIVKDYGDLEEMTAWDGIWRSAALNLFGAAGVYPLFDFYFSDELNWSFETSVYRPFTPDITAEILFSGGFSIFGQNEDIFSFDCSFYKPFNIKDVTDYQKTGLMYIWITYPENPINIPLIPVEQEALQIISNEEKLSLDFSDVFSMEIKHTTSLQLPGSLTLSAYGLFGYEYSNLADNQTSLFGFSFGISGSIIY